LGNQPRRFVQGRWEYKPGHAKADSTPVDYGEGRSRAHYPKVEGETEQGGFRLSREKEAGIGALQLLKPPVPASSRLKVWKLRSAIDQVKQLETSLELLKASKQTYLLCAEVQADFERMKQPFRDAMRRLKP